MPTFANVVQVNLVGIPQMHTQGRTMMNVDVALPILVFNYIVEAILHEIEVLLGFVHLN